MIRCAKSACTSEADSATHLNDDEIPVSIDDTILILSRAAQSGNHSLSEITLVGGQALNFWADRYFGSRDDFVSGDIDLLGGTAEALRCARAWDAKINVADMDSAMGSPNTAVVLIDRGDGNLPLRVDFLGNLIGPSVRDVLKARFEVLAKQGFSFHVMHPLHVMESRIGNAFYLGRKDESAMHRLELSFAVTKAHIQDMLGQDVRSGLKLVERVVEVVLSERGKMSWYAGYDPLTAIPDPADTPECPLLFAEKRWPQITAEVAAKRDAYASTMQQIEQFNRQRQQKEAAAGLEQSFHNGALPQPREGTITGTVRALAKDANANAFALVEVLQTAKVLQTAGADEKAFAVPISDADRDRLVIGETATFEVVRESAMGTSAADSARHCAIVAPPIPSSHDLAHPHGKNSDAEPG